MSAEFVRHLPDFDDSVVVRAVSVGPDVRRSSALSRTQSVWTPVRSVGRPPRDLMMRRRLTDSGIFLFSKHENFQLRGLVQ